MIESRHITEIFPEKTIIFEKFFNSFSLLTSHWLTFSLHQLTEKPVSVNEVFPMKRLPDPHPQTHSMCAGVYRGVGVEIRRRERKEIWPGQSWDSQGECTIQ